MNLTRKSVIVVGATGAVGREMLRILGARSVPPSQVTALASPRSEGTSVPYAGECIRVGGISDRALEQVQRGSVALFSAGSGGSREWAPRFAARGALVVDNSSAFRMDRAVPLVIPEVNAHALAPVSRNLRAGDGGIVAVPNCSAIIMLVALNPLRRAFGISDIVVSTYQAASGAGAKGLAQLERETRSVLSARGDLTDGVTGPVAPGTVFHEPYAFNLFSHNTAVDPATGLNVEEQKMIDESRKIWEDPALRIAPTCIRVPVLRAHSESIRVTLASPATVADVRRTLADAPGVRLLDNRAANDFPTPHKAAGGDDVLVGRVRAEPGVPEHVPSRVFFLFVAGDQLRKGAALDAVQIAETVDA